MKKILFTIALGVGILSTSLVSAQKLAHVNSGLVMTALPDAKAAETKLASYKQQLENRYKAMMQEYQGKIADFQQKESLMTDVVKQSKVEEIKEMEARIQKFEVSSQESIQDKNEELYQVIVKKVKDAIVAVAKEGAYTYVFDYSDLGGSIIYADNSKDITAKVKAKLGLQ
jgi:outer membrane protein